MKKIVLIPDSFKGTMSSAEICGIMENAIKKFYPHAEIAGIPVADGGEGSVDAFLTAVGGKKITVSADDPYFNKMDAFYGKLSDGKTGVIEMAACAGLPLVEDRRNPEKTTTFGVGALILRAIEDGCTKLIMEEARRTTEAAERRRLAA